MTQQSNETRRVKIFNGAGAGSGLTFGVPAGVVVGAISGAQAAKQGVGGMMSVLFAHLETAIAHRAVQHAKHQMGFSCFRETANGIF